MIRKLQHRFILLTMSCIGFIFFLILLILNISMTASSQNRGYNLLWEYVHRIEQSKNNHPNDWFNDMRIFSIQYNSTGEICRISTKNNPNLSESDLAELADTILKKPKDKGRISGYLYLYLPSKEGISIYFLDYGPEREMSMQLWRLCLWIGLAGMMIILVPVIFLSRWITKPVQMAFDKQKQFIADASHELKTPLTIITTNAEVLENSLPDNKWLNYILDQSKRMRVLINNLLDLARLDSENVKAAFHTFDLSKTVKNSSLPFESLAYEYKKTYFQNIDDGLSLYGNEENIKQLVTILLDNAFKYSNAKGCITISLTRSAGKNQLLVHNTGKGIDIKDQKHIFERFYRIDSSRSRQSGGYGLGLAIAKSITEAHKGCISVKSDGKSYTDFLVLLP